MSKEERLDYILSKLRISQKVEYAELSQELAVSEDTIRRDIKELAHSGLISKVKGGALPKITLPVSFQERELYAESNKRIIAQKAVQLFQDGQVVVFDGGTTPFLIASFLPRNIQLTLITHSFPIANLTFDFPHIELIFAGGKASKKSKVSLGESVLKSYRNIHADMCILGVHSLHATYGITDPIMEETEIKTTMAEMADKVVAVPTMEKLNAVSTFTVCQPETIDVLVTDLQTEDPLLKPYQQLGITLI